MHIKTPKVMTIRFQKAHVGPGKQKKRLDVKDNSLLEDIKKFHRFAHWF
jgi:hypothetical protein